MGWKVHGEIGAARIERGRISSEGVGSNPSPAPRRLEKAPSRATLSPRERAVDARWVYATSPTSDLRVGRRAEDDVGDVGDDLLERVLLVGGEFLPCGSGTEGVPLPNPVREILEAEHVGQIRQARSDERIAVKHLPKTCLLEDIEFTAIEHLDLAHVVAVGGALISAKLEQARAVLGGGRRHAEARLSFEGHHQRTITAHIGRLRARRTQECRTGLDVGGVPVETGLGVSSVSADVLGIKT